VRHIVILVAPVGNTLSNSLNSQAITRMIRADGSSSRYKTRETQLERYSFLPNIMVPLSDWADRDLFQQEAHPIPLSVFRPTPHAIVKNTVVITIPAGWLTTISAVVTTLLSQNLIKNLISAGLYRPMYKLGPSYSRCGRSPGNA
jgi:hypothetical protein